MNNKSKRNCTINKKEIGLLAFTVIFGAIAYLNKEISNDMGYIVWAIGGLLVISVISLRMELNSQFDDNIEIYQILEGLEDKEYREKGNDILKDCKIKLRDLDRGYMELESEEVFDKAIMRLREVKKTVHTTHLAITPDLAYEWRKEKNKKYYEANKEAVNKGVKIHRIFILDKKNIIDDNNNIIDKETIEILEEQSKYINVYILEKEEIPVKMLKDILVEDFAIFDTSVVHIQYSNLGRIIKDETIIQDYEKKFAILSNPSKPFKKSQDLIDYYESIK